MIKQYARAFLVPVLFLVGSAQAQQAQVPPSKYPMMDMVAQKIVDKYNNSTCAQLAEMKGQKPSGQKAEMEQRVIQMMKNDPEMRKAFIDRVAAPIANKMFECGMIP